MNLALSKLQNNLQFKNETTGEKWIIPNEQIAYDETAFSSQLPTQINSHKKKQEIHR